MRRECLRTHAAFLAACSRFQPELCVVSLSITLHRHASKYNTCQIRKTTSNDRVQWSILTSYRPCTVMLFVNSVQSNLSGIKMIRILFLWSVYTVFWAWDIFWKIVIYISQKQVFYWFAFIVYRFVLVYYVFFYFSILCFSINLLRTFILRYRRYIKCRRCY